ncbi:cysteine protease rdl2-related [Anaeramoeba flamelloides]|uniref:Cysteine protease rdl2-related n=1 Tax=Anaeramoeba flamelloides TaxID=1746091 RepID=A0AAV8ABA2_9EUKA|nr:cysteine protease rdl2-related [Anaeramoeba flamelloides]
MKFLLIALLVIAAFCEPLTEENYNFLFSKFQTQYNKNYRPEEQALRFSLFKSNLDRIKAHNARTDVSFKTGINQFSDWTRDEYLSILPNMPLQYSDAPVWDNKEQPTAESVDWRKKGAVTPVKDQGQCGSCWSFSTTGTMEGRDFIDTGVLNSYSESMIVDCDSDCYGSNVRRKEHVQATQTSKLDQKLLLQPLSNKTVQSLLPSTLLTGVSNNTNQVSTTNQIAHHLNLITLSSVLDMVSKNNDKYWIVKNSWNTSWGNEGYIYMAKDKSNNCGIATSAVYPNSCKNL